MLHYNKNVLIILTPLDIFKCECTLKLSQKLNYVKNYPSPREGPISDFCVIFVNIFRLHCRCDLFVNSVGC